MSCLHPGPVESYIFYPNIDHSRTIVVAVADIPAVHSPDVHIMAAARTLAVRILAIALVAVVPQQTAAARVGVSGVDC